MRLLHLICWLALSTSALSQSNLPNYPQKTEVVIKEINEMKNYLNIFVNVEAATRDSQVIIFLKHPDREGFSLAKSIPGEPPLPRTRDFLPGRDNSSRHLYKSTWFMNVLTPPESRPSAVYVVVVELRQRYTEDRTVDSLRLHALPFPRVKEFHEVLLLLQDFGWIPTGFTTAAL